MEKEESKELARRRMRNRVIEALELFTPEEQERILKATPYAYLPYEATNSWEEWVTSQPPTLFTIPPYTEEELKAIASFSRTWRAELQEIPDDYPSIQALAAIPAWQNLSRKAMETLEILNRRGKYGEE